MNYIRPAIRRMRGYEYGTQPNRDGVTKLNTNENPYPPSPRVTEVLRGFDTSRLKLYPNATASSFRDLIAERHDVNPEQVVVTNGGDEGIRLLFTTCLDPGDIVATTNPTYSLYEVLAAIQGCKIHATPLDRDFALPEDCGSIWNLAKAKVACLVNPHSPSGRLYQRECVLEIANRFEGILLLDEAYVDFVDPDLNHELVSLVEEFERVVILRTLSKGYALAGIRLGYLIGNADLIGEISGKTRDSYNVDSIAQELGAAAFADIDYQREITQSVQIQRDKLRSNLLGMGFDVPRSEANFLLASDREGRSLKELQLNLGRLNILVRHFDTPELRSSIRITVGTESQNTTLLHALDRIRSN